MKNILFLITVFLSGSFFVQGQNADSLSVTREVDSLIRVSRTLAGQRDYDKAFEVVFAAEKSALERLGRESAAYGRCCLHIGRLFYLKNNYPEAEKRLLEAQAVLEKSLGKIHADYANTLLFLGGIYENLRLNSKTIPLYLEALEIREQLFGKESPAYLYALTRLPYAYTALSRFDEALKYALELQSLQEKVNGKNHPDYAQSLYYLAQLYLAMYRFETAEPYYLTAIEIFETAPGGKLHVFYLPTLDGLGALYQVMGRYAEAEKAWMDVSNMREQILGKESEQYALSQLNLGNLYSRTGRSEEAEIKWNEAKNIYEKLYGPDHFMVGACMANLGLVYAETGRYKEAAESLHKSRVNTEKGGITSPYSLLNLARLYDVQNMHDSTEKYLLGALSVWKNNTGEEDPEYIKFGLRFLAHVFMKQGRYTVADSVLRSGSRILQTILTKSVTFLSERELGEYLQLFKYDGDNLLSFAYNRKKAKGLYSNEHTQMVAQCYDNSLFYKGYLMNAISRIRLSALSDTAGAILFDTLVLVKKQLAQHYALSIDEPASIQLLEEKANRLEKELASTVTGFKNAIRQVSWLDVQNKLSHGEAVIEFADFQISEWAKATDSVLYVALLLRKNDPHPHFIPLFEEKQLSGLLSLENEQQRDQILNAMYSRGVQPLKAKRISGLFDLVWQPLDSLLTGIKTVYYSPAGLLYRLNFDAIPYPLAKNEEIQNLADRYHLVRLGSTRALAIPDEKKFTANSLAVLFGGIHFEADTVSEIQSHDDSVAKTTHASELTFAHADRSLPLRGAGWHYLEGTKLEVVQIQPLLESSKMVTKVFSNKEATEESFKFTSATKDKPSPRILHLATHGFFFPDPKDTLSRSPLRGLGGDEPVFKISDHPMIRSGLILAGGNHAWKTGKPLRPGMEDGILTAYEISQMNLSNTELVVLSACETGLGDIQGNEGVYGLQRAFKIAGAKYLVMSLWQVPDRETSEFMITFYRHWLEGKMTIPDAFRATQKEMRERFINPYQWAGFVLVE